MSPCSLRIVGRHQTNGEQSQVVHQPAAAQKRHRQQLMAPGQYRTKKMAATTELGVQYRPGEMTPVSRPAIHGGLTAVVGVRVAAVLTVENQ